MTVESGQEIKQGRSMVWIHGAHDKFNILVREYPFPDWTSFVIDGDVEAV